MTPKTNTLSIRLSDEIREQVTTTANQKDVSISQVVREAIREYFKDSSVA